MRTLTGAWGLICLAACGGKGANGSGADSDAAGAVGTTSSGAHGSTSAGSRGPTTSGAGGSGTSAGAGNTTGGSAGEASTTSGDAGSAGGGDGGSAGTGDGGSAGTGDGGSAGTGTGGTGGSVGTQPVGPRPSGYLVYSGISSGNPNRVYRVRVDADGVSEPMVVSTNVPEGSTIPTGARRVPGATAVYYTMYGGGADAVLRAELDPTTNPDPIALTDPIDFEQHLIHQSFNDDASRFYYVVETPGESLSHLYMVELEGGTPSSPEWISGPVDRIGLVGWSDAVFYYREIDVNDDAELYRVDTSAWPPAAPQLLSSDQNSGTGEVWARLSPDGTRIVYDRELSGGDVYWYSLDPTQANPTPELMVGTALDVATSQFFWSPNSAHVVAELSQPSVLDLDSTLPEGAIPFWSGPSSDVWEQEFSPSGDRLLFSVVLTSSDDHIFVSDLTGGSLMGVPLINSDSSPHYSGYGALQWFPDSRFVALLMSDKTGPYLADFENPGAAPMLIGEGATGVTTFQVSPYGGYVAFAADRGGLADMFVVSVNAQGRPGTPQLVSSENTLPLAGAFHDPCFLSDEWLLFYENEVDGPEQFFIAPVDGSVDAIPVGDPSHDKSNIVWVPDP